MKSIFTINEKKQVILETLSENITNDEYIKLKYDEFHHKKFNRNFNLIADIRNCDKSVSLEFLQSLINVFKENKGKVYRKKSALVVTDLSNLKKIDLKTESSAHEIKVFTELSKAEKWLQS